MRAFLSGGDPRRRKWFDLSLSKDGWPLSGGGQSVGF